MHMADALLSPAVGGTLYAVSAAAIAYSVTKINKDDLSEKKVPVMAVSGAFVFAAQMINFTIPVTGSSGHIGGGMLLAGMLGGPAALLVITIVLAIQALFFADGGLLALGCNIFNLGVIPCLIIYPLVFKPILKKTINNGRITLASVLSVILALQLGAFGVVLQTLLSGVTELPFSAFVLLMQPIHLAIGIIEGIITAGVLCFVYNTRPEIIQSTISHTPIAKTVSVKKTVAILAVIAVLVGGGLSIFASANPDGLEWAIEKVAGTTELEASGNIFDKAEEIQEGASFLPDYDYQNAGEEGSSTGTTVSGIVGGLITFAIAGLVGFVISKYKKRKRKASASEKAA